MGFTRDELLEFKGRTVPDLIGPDCRLLFVGINPGLWTAATQTHFAHPGNRFYPALKAAGIIDRHLDRTSGIGEDDRRYLTSLGLGFTNLVARATARASELNKPELVDGAGRLEALVFKHEPRVVAVAGISAYRAAFGRRTSVQGRQPEKLSGSVLWVVPNPSGLNAHETTESLATWYRQAALDAGVL